jgi:HPt (histidine-containing phosphotransfer) domain-containing protein
MSTVGAMQDDDIARAAGLSANAAIARLGGHRDVYLIALQGLIDELALLPGNWPAGGPIDDQSRRLHTIKGLAATAGADELQQLAAGAEALATSGDPGLQAALARFNERTTYVLPLLRQALASWESLGNVTPTTARGTPLAIHREIERLRGQLQASDLAAVDTMRMVSQLIGPSPEPAVRQLERAVKSLDFQQAMQLCAELLQDEPA